MPDRARCYYLAMSSAASGASNNSDGPIRLTAPEGTVEIRQISEGRYHVALQPNDPNLFLPLRSCETSEKPETIAEYFRNGSYPWFCEFLSRHDDQGYVAVILRRQLLAYFDPTAFDGKRILDFGCGSGASTLCMAGMFPTADIVGAELSQHKLDIARRLVSARGFSNVRLLLSPDGNSLPAGIGLFDFVMLSAVYEHVLPDERPRLLPLIWSVMKPGALLFVNQTPYRYFPYENHSTSLWFINYMPDRMAHWLARNVSKTNPEVNKSPNWNDHLRGGIRGGTEAEILRNLRRAKSGEPEIIQPKDGDRASYWLSCTSPERHRIVKRTIASFFRLTDKFFGTIPSTNLDVVIRKGSA